MKKLILFLLFFYSFIVFGVTPEEETQRLSKLVKPIPDSIWQTIASEKISETYEINSGDTLYDISERLFGDAKYWPKIWAVNNNNILNPHLIFPGNKVVFQSGTGNELPQLGLSTELNNTSENNSLNSPQDHVQLTQSSRSKEWQNLPRQSWEQVQFKSPPEVDPDGIDRRSVIQLKSPDGFFPPILVSDEEFYIYGKLKNSTQPSTGLTKGDKIFIKSEEELEIDQEFSIVEKPTQLNSSLSKYSHFTYLHLGIAKIVQQNEDQYEAVITNAFFPIYREAQIIKKIAKIKNPKPLPGPSPLPAKIIAFKELSSNNLTQHTYAMVDRGSSDGIEPGMIFRAYQYIDPQTNKEITENDDIFLADFMVVQTSESYSTVVGINSLYTVENGSNVILLTDVSQYLKQKKMKSSILEADGKKIDELDRIDLGDEINESEKSELDELNEIEDSGELEDDFSDLNDVDETEASELDDLDDFEETNEFDELDESLETEEIDSLEEPVKSENIDELEDTSDSSMNEFDELDDLTPSETENSDLNLENESDIESLDENVKSPFESSEESSAPSKADKSPPKKEEIETEDLEDDSLEDFDVL